MPPKTQTQTMIPVLRSKCKLDGAFPGQTSDLTDDLLHVSAAYEVYFRDGSVYIGATRDVWARITEHFRTTYSGLEGDVKVILIHPTDDPFGVERDLIHWHNRFNEKGNVLNKECGSDGKIVTNIILDAEQIREIDDLLAKSQLTTRSEAIRAAIQSYLFWAKEEVKNRDKERRKIYAKTKRVFENS